MNIRCKHSYIEHICPYICTSQCLTHFEASPNTERETQCMQMQSSLPDGWHVTAERVDERSCGNKVRRRRAAACWTGPRRSAVTDVRALCAT